MKPSRVLGAVLLIGAVLFLYHTATAPLAVFRCKEDGTRIAFYREGRATWTTPGGPETRVEWGVHELITHSPWLHSIEIRGDSFTRVLIVFRLSGHATRIQEVEELYDASRAFERVD